MQKKELSFSPELQAPARKGRRAGVGIMQQNIDDDIGSPDDLLESPIYSPPKSVFPSKSPTKVLKNNSFVPPHSRKTGGWADENTSKSNKSRRSSTNIIEQERFQSPERMPKHDSDDDIPLIPDLDEMQDEEILSRVAEAPFVAGNKVASFTELDTDLAKKSAFSKLGNINLSILTSHLLPEEDVQESNEKWTWDLLFTEVASDLRNEWDVQNADIPSTE